MADDKTPEKILVAYPEFGGVDISHPPLKAFCEYCLSVKKPGEYADRQHFDFFLLRRWLGYLMILEHEPAANDFHYRLYGTRIAEYAGFDLTGRRVSDLPLGIGAFIAAQYRECVGRRKLIYSEHSRVHARYSCDWHRVLCPVKDGDRVQIVGCNVPVATPIAPE